MTWYPNNILAVQAQWKAESQWAREFLPKFASPFAGARCYIVNFSADSQYWSVEMMKVSLSLAYDDCARRMLRDWGCRAPIAKSRTSGKTNPISTKSTAGWHLIPGKRRPSSNNYMNDSIQNNSLARVRMISALTIFSFFQSAPSASISTY